MSAAVDRTSPGASQTLYYDDSPHFTVAIWQRVHFEPFGSRATERDCLLYAGMKYLDLILVLVSLAAAQNNPSNGAVNDPVTGGGRPTGVPTGSVLVSNGILQPDLDQTKPVIDARDQGFVGNGSTDNTTAANTLLTAIGPTRTTIVFPAGTYVMGSVTFPINVGLDFKQGAILSPSTGHTITIAGPILASPTRIFTNIASGQGAISLTGNRSLTRISPVWFGLNCSGVGDNAPIWKQILAFTGDDSTFVLPQNCVDMHASTVTVSSRAGFKLISEDRAQNGGGNQRPEELWTGTSGGMWFFQANQAPTIEGFLFTNLSTAPVAYYLAVGDNPTTYINTEAMVRYNTFTNNQSAPSGFSAVIFAFDTSQNTEKNVATDNDFFCSQSRALNETNTGEISSSSNVLTCGSGGCSFTTDATVGERVRVSYAAGILDTIVSSIIDNNHLVMTAASSVNQSKALITFGQAYGTGITIGSVNTKHNTLERDSFTQCQYGLYVSNGSFSAAHFGGSANDNLVYINDISEPSELDYLEDENSLRDLYTAGPLDASLTLSHMRNSNTSAESDGFIYFGAGGGITITGSVLQDAVNTNSVLIGAATPSSVNLTSIGNYWSPGPSTMATLGYAAWRTAAEGGPISGGTLISCGDFGPSDAPGWCYQFGDGADEGGTNEGNIVISSDHFNNVPSFNTYTAEPHAANAAFINEARGFQTNFVAGTNSTSMNFVGFDTTLSPNGGLGNAMRGGNTIGYRFTMPIVNSTAQPSSIGLLVNPPTANTLITNAYGVYVGNLASVTGITNRYSFYSAGATDTMFLAGLLNIGGQFTSTLATGTAPFSITSTTPVANLTASNHPQVYEAGVLTTAEKIYTNTQALTTGAATHTFANSFTYTSSSTFGCTCTDQTAANACKAVPASATTVTLAGTGSDTLWLSCSGH